MELFSFPSSSVSISPSSSSRKVLIHKNSFFSGQTSTLANSHRYPNARKLKISHFRGQASDSKQASSKSNPGIAQATQQETQSKDENLVFVAGATGKVGSRTVRELLKLGFRVRAGVRSAQKAESLVQSVQQMKLEGASAVEKLDIVECDLGKDRIELAIANASVVICCIGASEKEVFDITGPYRIDYQATKNLIDAATLAGVNHFILLTSLGTNKIGFPAAILNLFWGVLIWKRKAEEALINSGLPYTIVRPGGMERPTDAYKETHNVSLANEDTLFGGQVSNLQVAELIAFMSKNRSTSYCKVVEVIAETTAPLSPFAELLSEIPSQRLDSPSPKEPQTASEPVPVPSQSVVLESSNSVIEKEPVQTDVLIPKPLSPYIGYDDWKPPSSPSPNAWTVPLFSESTIVGTQISTNPESSTAQQSPTLNEPEDRENVTTPKPRPLSPFTMYEGLKPPSSPTPRNF